MRLNADILYNELAERFDVGSRGSFKKELTLKRPVFYHSGDGVLLPDQIYICRAEELTELPDAGEGSLLVCISDDPPAGFLNGKYACILVREQADLLELYDAIHQIFNRFDQWEEQLTHILNTTADLNELIRVSDLVIGNPIQLIDSQFRFLAYSDVIDEQEDLAMYRPDANGYFQSDYVASCISDQSMYPSVREPIFVEEAGVTHVSYNLFERHDYIGNISIAYVLRPYRPGDEAVGQYLADVMQKAIVGHDFILSGRTHIVKSAFRDALDGEKIDFARRNYLAHMQTGGEGYVCLRVLLSDQTQKSVPAAYICNHFETSIPRSIAFQYESSVVVCIRVRRPFTEQEGLYEDICQILEQMQLKGGISDVFTEPGQILAYYRQATIALQLGGSDNPSALLYSFHKYALQYLISHSYGEFSSDMMLTDGLRRLMEHDHESQGKASYIETLRAYLNNNMNITRAAQELYLHKSSLLARLTKIRELLQCDLEDPDQRLRIQILLKHMEMEALYAHAGSGPKLNSYDSDSGERVKLREGERIDA